ncbi:MAG: ergothioneine biosynthesis protein EgtC [Myxococcota bacterium]
MCRILSYLGPSRSADELLRSPPNSLEVQSYQPKEMTEALLNADGFGFAWYTPARPEPARYRSVLPIWSDDNLKSMAPHIRSRCLLANVRSATPGLAVHRANTQPFIRGNLAFVHNGLLGSFRQALMRPLRKTLSDASYAALEGNTDSEHIFALIADVNAASLAERVRCGMYAVSTIVEGLGERALLNVSVTDGVSIVSVRYAIRDDPPSLYLVEETPWGEGSLVCSEPMFQQDIHHPLRPGELVIQTAEGVVRESL